MYTDQIFDLSDRVAFVSGGAGHLGSVMVHAMAEAGAVVYVNGRNEDRLKEFCDTLNDMDLDARPATFDIMDRDAVALFFEDLPRLDVLINNAYTGRAGSLETATRQDFDTAFDSAVTAAFDVCRSALPALQRAVIETGAASIINISSMYGHISPNPALYGDSGLNSPPFYGPAKAALIQMTKYLACHWAQKNIRVNVISPGPFPTDGIQAEKPEFIERLANKNPMGRIGQPGEIAGPTLFLASDASSYVTGANLCVDGGWTAW
jgi:NAD(P)-dependent dehydrogenase (short-subunit alcohol dehydrogenase family)